jgi:alpha-tubulin suppressor-like RCC1 family protein
LTGVAELALGWDHSCARFTGGDVQCWGLNNAGQIGDGTTMDKPTPTPTPVVW